ncbi:MAG: CBS domain-containing protein [Deltaproteobacteria bacterium]|nr:CBS domain-containing protein [Deltaproteobacteria bacterium]
MKEYKVRDLMIPFEDHPRVLEDDTLQEVVTALSNFREKHPDRPACEYVLVTDATGKVLGRIGPLDVIAAIESGYAKVGDLSRVTRQGYSPRFLKALIEADVLWENPLADLCRKAMSLNASNIMHVMGDDQFVDADQTMDKALHKLVTGPHRSFLVTEGEKVVGILRLSDVYGKIQEQVKACGR